MPIIFDIIEASRFRVAAVILVTLQEKALDSTITQWSGERLRGNHSAAFSAVMALNLPILFHPS